MRVYEVKVDGIRIPPDAREIYVLRLPYPISANRYWKAITIPGRTMMAPSKEAKAFKHEVGVLARAAGIRYPLQGRLRLTIRLYPKRPLDWAKRAQKDPDGWADTVQCLDLDNCVKVLNDALNGIAWNDDKQLWHIELDRCEPDEHGARTELLIQPLNQLKFAPELPLCGI